MTIIKQRRLYLQAILLATWPITSLLHGASSSYLLSGILINLYLLNQSPLSKKFLGFEVQCTSPMIEFSKKDQRLFFSSPVMILIPNQLPVRGNIALDSSFTYDPATFKISLKDPRLTHLTVDAIQEINPLLVNSLSPFLGQLFHQQVVYVLSPTDLKILKKPPSAILVEDGGIRFNFD